MQMGRCCHCRSLSAYIGSVTRHFKPETISDYEAIAAGSLLLSGVSSSASTAWSTGTIYSNYTNAGALDGPTIECYYRAVEMDNATTDEINIIMDPVRYSIDGAATAGDQFDNFLEVTYNSGGGYYDSDYYGTSTRLLLTVGNSAFQQAGNTLLPASGDSHVSDGTIGAINWSLLRPDYSPSGLTGDYPWVRAAYYAFAGWRIGTAAPIANNQLVRPAFYRIRINGSAVGDLVEIPYTDNTAASSPFHNFVSPGQGIVSQTLYWFINSAGNAPPGFLSSSYVAPWDLTFTAGDTIEIDVWWQLRAYPHYQQSIAGRNWMIAVIPRYETVSGSRSMSYNFPAGKSRKLATFIGMDVAAGFNPASHTFTFNFGSHSWHAGDGLPGAKKAETVSVAQAIPTYVGRGDFIDEISGSMAVDMPASIAEDDILRLWVYSISGTPASPSGWSFLASYGGTTSSDIRLSLYWKRATGSETTVTVATGGNPCGAFVDAVRGCITTGSPFSAYSGVYQSTPVTALTVSGIGTATNNAFVSCVSACNYDPDTALTATMTNSALSSFTQRITANDLDGSDQKGAVCLATGTLASSGNTGGFEITWNDGSGNVSLKHAAIIAAMKPAAAVNWNAPVITSSSLLWAGRTIDEERGEVSLMFGGEIALLKITKGNYYWTYRPQDSGDYVTEVDDATKGTLYNSPCGVFNHLGTTVFERWYGPTASGFSPPTEAGEPSTVTVIKVNQ